MDNQQKRAFFFHEPQHRDVCKTFLDTIPIGEGHQVWQVVASPYKKNRTLAQQSLMWIWHDQWSQHFGDTKAAEHIRFKADYILPIYLRDYIVDGLHEMYQDAVEASTEGYPQRLQAIYRLVSSTRLNTQQMAEALTEYQSDAAMEGCHFRVTCREYKEAMGHG